MGELRDVGLSTGISDLVTCCCHGSRFLRKDVENEGFFERCLTYAKDMLRVVVVFAGPALTHLWKLAGRRGLVVPTASRTFKLLAALLWFSGLIADCTGTREFSIGRLPPIPVFE